MLMSQKRWDWNINYNVTQLRVPVFGTGDGRHYIEYENQVAVALFQVFDSDDYILYGDDYEHTPAGAREAWDDGNNFTPDKVYRCRVGAASAVFNKDSYSMVLGYIKAISIRVDSWRNVSDVDARAMGFYNAKTCLSTIEGKLKYDIDKSWAIVDFEVIAPAEYIKEIIEEDSFGESISKVQFSYWL